MGSPDETIQISPTSGLNSLKDTSSSSSSIMANAINTLLSLRDAVRIQGPSTTSNITTAINLGLLSNSALLNDRNYASPPISTGNDSRNSTPTRHYHHLENTNTHRSPKISPQSIASNSPSSSTTRNNGTNNINNSNHNNSLNWSTLTNGHLLNSSNINSNTSENDLLSPSEILVDELSYLYPQEDFTLLRKACLKNEITLMKISSRYHYGNNGYSTSLTPSSPSSNNNNNNHISSNGGGGGSSSSLKDDYMTQQTLQLIKQQNEYVQMLQQSGVNLPVFPGDMTMGTSLNLSTDHSNSKFPAWFHPLAHAAAAAGILPTPTNTAQNLTHNHGKNINGGSSNINSGNGGSSSRKKNSITTDSHMFLSPKIPTINSNKPKTVAAALAATRPSSNLMMGTNGVGMGNGKSSSNINSNNNNNNSSSSNNNGNNKRLSGSRKRSQRSKTSTITRPPPPIIMDDDDIDPTSMLEVTTSLPNDNYCMDLTTERSSSSSSILKGIDSHHQLSLNSPPLSSSFSSLSNNNNNNTEHLNINGKSNGHNLLSAASLSLENYLRNVLPNNNNNNNNNMKNNNNYTKSPSPTSSTESNPTTTSSTVETISESDRKKQQVLEAFNFDPEVAGDARGLARKFGLNIRVVLKWLREGPSKSLPALLTKPPPNGGLNLIMDNPMFSTMGDGMTLENGIGSGKLGSATSANNNNNNNQKKLLPNKRKNTKPNQICDFQNDDLTDDTESSPLDMVVPIKKRRVSNSNNNNNTP